MSLSGEDMGDDLVRLYAFVLVSSSLADMFHTISRLTRGQSGDCINTCGQSGDCINTCGQSQDRMSLYA